ncbi:hypothetical protein P7C70_g7859, partial [Phenoliferia sp. Uapishka_3]
VSGGPRDGHHFAALTSLPVAASDKDRVSSLKGVSCWQPTSDSRRSKSDDVKFFQYRCGHVYDAKRLSTPGCLRGWLSAGIPLDSHLPIISSSNLPTAFLPRLPRKLTDLLTPHPSQHLLSLVDRLRKLYLTPATSSTGSPAHLDSGYSSEDDACTAELAEAARHTKDDVFESAWAKEWLLQVVRRGQEWVELADGKDVEEEERRVRLVDEAAALVAALSETSESGSIVRPLLLPTSEPPTSEPLLVTLFDALPSATDATSVGLQSWGSSILLARMIALNPQTFDVRPTGGRVLELGAGTGLLSLVWRAMCNRLLADAAARGEELKDDNPTVVLATDYHDAVLENLRKNVADNTPSHSAFEPEDTTTPTCELSVQKLDWSAIHGSRSFALSNKNSLVMPAPFDKPFDTLLGADIVYGPTHALWLRSCCEQFLARPEGAPTPAYATPQPSPYPSPTSSPSLRAIDSAFSMTRLSDEEVETDLPFIPCETSAFHLIVPLRPTHQLAIASIADVFPMAEDLEGTRKEGDWKIAIQSMVEVSRVRGVGRVDEGSYRLYRIGWC